MSITLRPLGDGSYAVHDGDGHDLGATVVNGVRRWVVHRAGVGVSGEGWDKASQVVAWLESEAGARWLEEAP